MNIAGKIGVVRLAVGKSEGGVNMGMSYDVFATVLLDCDIII